MTTKQTVAGNGSASGGSGKGTSWKPGDPERRSSSSKVRRKYARDHGLPLPSSSGGDGDNRSLKDFLPKSALWMLASFALTVSGWFAKQWTDDRLKWMSSVDVEIRRIEPLVRQVQDVAVEVRDFRVERLEEQLWLAKRRNDEEGVRYFDRQLQKLKDRESRESKEGKESTESKSTR